MIKLRVKEINAKNEYLLENEKDGKQYRLCICFYSKNSPVVDDEIIISKNLLNKKYEGYCQPYFFGELEDKTGRDSNILQDDELISWQHDGKKNLLKRIYG